MKNFIIIIAIVVVMSIFVTGCGMSTKVFKDQNDDPTNYELEPEPAWKYERIDWSKHRATVVLPIPNWTWWGYALIDTDLSYYGYLGYTSFDNFEDYINELKKAGYTENCDINETSSNIYWIAEHESNGYTAMVHYCSWSDYITVWSYHDGNELRDRFWKE